VALSGGALGLSEFPAARPRLLLCLSGRNKRFWEASGRNANFLSPSKIVTFSPAKGLCGKSLVFFKGEIHSPSQLAGVVPVR
jgi:hypothetical protein